MHFLPPRLTMTALEPVSARKAAREAQPWVDVSETKRRAEKGRIVLLFLFFLSLSLFSPSRASQSG